MGQLKWKCWKASTLFPWADMQAADLYAAYWDTCWGNAGQWGGHKLWNETMKRSVSHSKTPTSENKPGGMCTVMTGTTSWRDTLSQSATQKPENAQTCFGIYTVCSTLTGCMLVWVTVCLDNKPHNSNTVYMIFLTEWSVKSNEKECNTNESRHQVWIYKKIPEKGNKGL